MVIKGVIKEELQNSLGMLKWYRQAYAALPKGSIVVKKINGQEYEYLVLRQKGRVVFKYLKDMLEKEKVVFREAKKKRQEYRKLIADLKDEVKFIKRALHERKRRAV